MDNELWEPIPGYEGIYEISNTGRFRGLPRKDNRGMFRPGIVFTPGKMSGGYAGVTMSRNGRQRSALLHQLVARAFIGPAPPGKEVNHIDGDRMNASLDNLEYVTKSEQQIHRFRVLKHRAVHGNSHHMAKLNDKSVHAIRDLAALGTYTQRDLGALFGVTYSNIGAILRGQTWQ